LQQQGEQKGAAEKKKGKLYVHISIQTAGLHIATWQPVIVVLTKVTL